MSDASLSVTPPQASDTPSPEAMTPDALFDAGIARYQAGEDAATLIPVFKDLCDRAPKSGAAWTCLSWLYLLTGKGDLALKAAKKAVKLSPQDAQSRLNLAAAMLETKQKGVRDQVEIVENLIMIDEDMRAEIHKNLADGLERAPNSKAFQRLKTWLMEA